MAEPSVAEVTPARFAEVEARIARIDSDACARDGHRALGDAVWLDLEHPGSDSAGFLVGDRAYAHVAPGETSRARQRDRRALVPRGSPSFPRRVRDGIRGALVAAAAAHVAAHGGGRIVLWVLGAGTEPPMPT